MKSISNLLTVIITGIAWLVFAAGIVLACIGIYDFVMTFTHLGETGYYTSARMAISLLHAVDMFLLAIVFFVMALGLFILFYSPEKPLPVKLPEWLRIKTFIQLKIILWEAILTTLVVSWLASLAERKIRNEPIDHLALVIPAGVLIISLSLFLLKKGEN